MVPPPCQLKRFFERGFGIGVRALLNKVVLRFIVFRVNKGVITNNKKVIARTWSPKFTKTDLTLASELEVFNYISR